jgi:hypothetical protein
MDLIQTSSTLPMWPLGLIFIGLFGALRLLGMYYTVKENKARRELGVQRRKAEAELFFSKYGYYESEA